ncbi:MAG: AI-2E family transporter [Erysipelotrichaceae bacterium]|nr:AI-2E family transporter [Erysipelotrichaceae bacterium]
MKFKLSKEALENILTYSISGICIVFCYFILKNFDGIKTTFVNFLNIIMPFVFGMCIAFIVLPVVKNIEGVLLKNSRLKNKTKRVIAVSGGILFLILVVASFFAILIPQLYSSVNTLIGLLPGYLESAKNLTLDFLVGSTQFNQIFDKIIEYGNVLLTTLLTNASTFLPSLLNYSYSFIITIGNMLIGLIIAVYMLLDKERFTLQVKKVMYSILPKSFGDKLGYVGDLTARMFNQFIFGKALDSLIIGVICFIVLQIANFPYALLISFIVGLTNMIPVFGPFIGAIPSIFILLIIDPIKAAWFALFILILQQIDGNIIGPSILGDSMGLPSLWIMFSIIVGGGLFGIVGMFIGVPVFSVIYILSKSLVDKILIKKGLEIK